LIDTASNQLSLIDTIENISVTVPPGGDLPEKATVELSCFLVSLWVRSVPDQPESAQFRVRLFDPYGQEIASNDLKLCDLDLTEKQRLRAQIRLQSLPLGAPGRYEFRVELLDQGLWQRMAQIPYELEIRVAGDEGPGSEIPVR
jgi:hypothetical protein